MNSIVLHAVSDSDMSHKTNQPYICYKIPVFLVVNIRIMLLSLWGFVVWYVDTNVSKEYTASVFPVSWNIQAILG
jgi:hypothetical protein